MLVCDELLIKVIPIRELEIKFIGFRRGSRKYFLIFYDPQKLKDKMLIESNHSTN